jgi:hypothetical protein
MLVVEVSDETAAARVIRMLVEGGLAVTSATAEGGWLERLFHPSAEPGQETRS